ncbi:MAG: RluA family pseudouridine synthase [Phycisphaerales bacterium]|nr:RluA family pseudouridine synthase [Phycisphaerales bacterium]
MVINKESGLLSVPGIGPEKADCLATRVASQFLGARIVHRLDRDTSGTIVMALDARTHRELSMQFETRQIEKHYQALVAGAPSEDQGVIDLPMRKDMVNPPLQVIDRELGRSAITQWLVLERMESPTRARLQLIPRTGRSHQIRLHLQALGHPILGDDLYAPAPVVALANRLCLHATRLSFTHPHTQVQMAVDSPAPF